MARMSTRLLGVRGILRARVGRLITIFREEGGGGWCWWGGGAGEVGREGLGVESVSRLVHLGMVVMVSYILFVSWVR